MRRENIPLMTFGSPTPRAGQDMFDHAKASALTVHTGTV